MSEDEPRARGIAILILLATDWQLQDWLERFDQEALEHLKEDIVGILRAEIQL